MQYEWINNVAKISSDYTIIEFHANFNQKIEPNTLPEKLIFFKLYGNISESIF